MTNLSTCIILTLITLSYSTELACQTSQDCPNSNSCEDNFCVRKDLFPLTPKEGAATFISVVVNVLLNIGGVGGGAVHIPSIHHLYETSIDKAVTISYACVFGGGLGYLASTIPVKDPSTKRYLINYDINLIVLPALMIGVGVGTLISKLLSPLLTGIIIVFVLGVAIMKNALKFKAALRKEKSEEHARKIYLAPQNRQMEAKGFESRPVEPVVVVASSIQEVVNKNERMRRNTVSASSLQDVVIKSDIPSKKVVFASSIQELGCRDEAPSKNVVAASSIQDVASKNDLPDQEQEPVKNFKRKAFPSSTTIISSASTFDRTYSRILSILVKDTPASDQADDIGLPVTKADHLRVKEQKFPFAKMRDVLVNILSIFVFGLIRGTKNFNSIFGVEWSLSWDLLWLNLGTICFCLATAKSIISVRKWQKEKKQADYEFLPQEPVLTKERIISLLYRSIIGGFASAVSTLAGAMIVGPALLNMGMPASFAAPTTNLFMILSMFNAVLGVLLNGNLSIQEFLWFMSLSFIFSTIVTKTINLYLKKTGKESTVIGMILGGTIIGVMCLISVMMQAMVENLSEHVKFGSF